MRANAAVLMMAVGLGLTVAAKASDDPGARRLGREYRCYRSFLKQPERTADFAKMGITTRCVFAANTVNSLGTPYCEYPPIWTGFGKYDWANWDAQVKDVLTASPDARLIVMVDLTMPYWMTRPFCGDAYEHVTDYCMDARWRRETTRYLKDFLAHSEKRWGDRIVAYVLSGGKTSEWYEFEDGHSSGRKDAAWRDWCARRGKTDYKPYCPPGPTRFEASFEGVVYDPVKDAEKIDYWRFHNGIVADAILHFAKEARTLLPRGGKKEIGVFFGYYFVHNFRQVSFGHLDYGRVFASPDIDFVIAPGNYSDRGMGGASGSQLPVASAALAGKRLMHEIDCWPHGHKMGWGGYFKTEADDFAGNTREAAFSLVNRTSHWWFDMWGGFYDNPALRTRIARLEQIAAELERSGYYEDPSVKSAAEVLYVCDPDSSYYINEESKQSDTLYRHFHNRLARTGFAFDALSFDDLAKADLAQYKMVCLPVSVNLTPAKAQVVKDRLCRDGRLLVWAYAPGLCDGRTLDPARVATWAGVPFGTDGVSVTDRGAWKAAYARDAALYTSEELARLASLAGAHRYVDELSPVYANSRLVAVHSATGGKKTIRLPKRAAKVTELVSGRTVAEQVDAFSDGFAAPDTKIYAFDIIRP